MSISSTPRQLQLGDRGVGGAGGRSWPAGPWDSSDALTGVVSALAVGEGRARAALSGHSILLSPLSKHQLLSSPASPCAGDLTQPRPSGRS